MHLVKAIQGHYRIGRLKELTTPSNCLAVLCHWTHFLPFTCLNTSMKRLRMVIQMIAFPFCFWMSQNKSGYKWDYNQGTRNLMQSQTSASIFQVTFGMCSSETMTCNVRTDVHTGRDVRERSRALSQSTATVSSVSFISLFTLSLTLTSPERIWEWWPLFKWKKTRSSQEPSSNRHWRRHILL